MNLLERLAELSAKATQSEQGCPVKRGGFAGKLCPKCSASDKETCRPMTLAYNDFGKALSDAYRSGQLGDATRIAALEERVRVLEGAGDALKWALPLAERAVDDHRMERIRCGHSNIVGTYSNGQSWVGIHQSEVNQIEKARAALDAALALGEQP